MTNPWADTPEEQEVVSSNTSGEKRDIVHFKPKQGTNTIRIIGTYKVFREYWLPNVSRTVIAGPLKDCPIYNHPKKAELFDKASKLRESGKEQEAKDLFRKAYSLYEPRARYAVNILDREDGQIKIWKFSRTVKESIAAIADKYGDPNEYDLILSRKGTGTNTEYTIIPERDSTPLTDEERALKTFNLTAICKPTPLYKVKAYLAGNANPQSESKSSESNDTQSDENTDAGLSEEELNELENLDDDLPF